MKNTVTRLFELVGQKSGRWFLLGLFAGGVSLLDAATAILVFALFGTLTSPSDGLSLPLIGDLHKFFPSLEPAQILLIGAGTITALSLLRSVAYVLMVYVQHRVVNNTAVDLSTRLMRGYLVMPYTFHLHRNTAEFVRNAWEATNRLVGDVLVPAVRTISESFIVLAILIVLFATAPAATVLTLVAFGPTMWLLLHFVHPRLERLGRTQQDMARASLSSFQQALQGLRDVKLLGREQHFVNTYSHQRRRLARARYLRGAASALPRTTIETVLVIFVAAFLAVTVLGERSPEGAFAVLGLFGYAAFRTLPSVNQILQQLNNLKFSAATVDDIYEDLRFFEGHAPERDSGAVEPLPLRREILLEDVTYRYEGSHTDALQNVTLQVLCDTALGIVGPTGGGKTTLVDVLTGLLEPISGRILVDGTDIRGHVCRWQRNLGVVPQTIFLLDDTLARNIAFGLPDAEIDEKALQEAVRLAQLEDFVASLPKGLDTVVGERGVRVSGGQRQRVAIARALYHRPQVLIFDEATSALDTVTERDFLSDLTSRLEGRTLIMVAHRITTVRDCDQIVVVEGGRITDRGRYDELLERSPSFRALASGTR